MYEIKNFKKFKGHEGEPCAQGTLHCAGKKIADWSDDANGGPLRLDFINETAEAAFLVYAKVYLSTRKDYSGKLHDVVGSPGWSLIESAVSDMSLDHESNASALRLAKTGVCFKVREASGEVEVYSIKVPYTAKLVAEIRAKYGSALEEIVNETLKMPLIDEATAKIANDNAHWKKKCKTLMIFSLRETDGTIKMMQTRSPYSSTAAIALKLKYPNLVEIINERYL